MIVIGIDPHMKTHTAVALDAATGASLGAKTVTGDERGHDALLVWARSLGPQRYFAIEDCRHVSGRLERHLLPRGERVVRVPPKMMAGARSSARTYGKSDPIDAAAVARAALREPGLPEASLAGPEQNVRLLVDHRDDLIGERKRIQQRLRWHAHDLEIALPLPPRVLERYVWLDRLEALLRTLPETVRARIALAELARCRELTVEIRSLERELERLMRTMAPTSSRSRVAGRSRRLTSSVRRLAPRALPARRPSPCTSAPRRCRSPRASRPATGSTAAAIAN